jgi:UDP-N-acetyl-2-amino-2-deoxyglucuronate dehydrogenase
VRISKVPSTVHHPPSTARFAIVGVAGYIAPRHLKAIKALRHNLVAAFDPNDSVGILDSHFPKAAFFTEFERFDRHLEKCRRNGEGIDYLVVCSPNYLHDAHIRYGLRTGADVICEKPLVLNPWNLEALKEIERETGKKVWSILQLRLHPNVIALKEKYTQNTTSTLPTGQLTYITPRGNWYHASWKGEVSKSGGIITNIGVHLFDMLLWAFGPVEHYEVHQRNHSRAAGYLKLAKAEIRWFLSIEAEALPKENTSTASRTLEIDQTNWNFSDGFTDLHTECYKNILANTGNTIDDCQPSIDLIHTLRTAELTLNSTNQHPLTVLPESHHPFEM